MPLQEIGFVYLMHSKKRGLYKIGLSAKSDSRRKQIGECVLIHTISTNDARRLEREMHAAYATVREAGEWFRLEAAMVAEIRGIESRTYDVGRPIKAVASSRMIGLPELLARALEEIADEQFNTLSEQVKIAVREYLVRLDRLPLNR